MSPHVPGRLERYLPKRLLVRFDAGDAISVYRPATFTWRGVVTPPVMSSPVDGLQMTVGFGWRF